MLTMCRHANYLSIPVCTLSSIFDFDDNIEDLLFITQGKAKTLNLDKGVFENQNTKTLKGMMSFITITSQDHYLN